MRIASWWARLRGLAGRFGGLFRARRTEDRLDEEFGFHLDMATERLIRLGLAPGAARREAQLQFGGSARWREEARDQARSRLLQDLVRDLRHGVTGLARQPAFALAAVLTIGLTLAAATTVFRFVQTVFLHRLEVPEGARLVRLQGVGPEGPRRLGYPAFRLLAGRLRTFDVVAAHYSTAPLYVTLRGASFEVQGSVVSWSYFPMLGIRPALGRFFLPSEDSVPDRDAVAVIGYRFWQRQFDGQADVVGRGLDINGRRFTIIGVAPRGFRGVEPGSSVNQLWIPAMMFHVGYRWCDALEPGCAITEVMARLAPGATLARSRAELSTLTGPVSAVRGDTLLALTADAATSLQPELRDSFLGLARLLTVVAGVLLLIGCVNVGGLLLARGLTRRREVALRTALGAGRGRIVRQLLAESLLVGVAGGLLAFLLSRVAAAELIRFFTLDDEGYLRYFDLDGGTPVAAFAGALVLFATVGFGLLPAIVTSGTRPFEALGRGRGDPGGHAGRLRSGLIGAQVALSLVLLVGALLLARSAARVVAPAGFRTEGVALLRLRPRLVGYPPARAQAFLRAAQRALEARPDVESVGLVPIRVVWGPAGQVSVGRPDREGSVGVGFQEVSPGFLGALGIRLLAGRAFTEGDSAGTPRVALVTESLARRLWPGAKALDRPLVVRGKEFRVVGVVADYVLYRADQAPGGMVLLPMWQGVFNQPVDARLAVRVRGDPAEMLPALQATVQAVDPTVPVTETLPLATQVSVAFTPVRVGRAVLLAAALLALGLSAIGLYGVVAFLVTRRRREIGVRLAVGARPGQVMALCVRQGLRPVLWGGVIGLGLALGGAGLLRAWLVGVSPLDPASFLWALGALLVVTLIATWVPARRAAHVDPATVLRQD